MRHTEITTLLKLPIHFQGQLANVTRHQTRTLRIRILITTDFARDFTVNVYIEGVRKQKIDAILIELVCKDRKNGGSGKIPDGSRIFQLYHDRIYEPERLFE